MSARRRMLAVPHGSSGAGAHTPLMREPIAISVALGAVLATGVALLTLAVPGITPELSIAIIAFGNAIIGLGVAWFARSQSTPLADPHLREGTVVNVETPKGQPDQLVTLSPAIVGAHGVDIPRAQ